MSERGLPEWGRGELPEPPRMTVRGLVGPGLLMAGAAIGGGEWLFGSVVTARYGGGVMWIAGLSILFQAIYNLAVMRYALFTGEPILVAFLRTRPGPRFWAAAYLAVDLGYIWPYLAANAAVPLAAAVLGRMPSAADDALVRNLGYCIFLSAFVPLIFGRKVYNAVEAIMSAKVILVLGYLVIIDLLFVSASAWAEVFTGFLRFGSLPTGDVEWSTLAAFAAVAGAGGLSNTLMSNYVRDKGWGMGASVGAIPSLVGGRRITLSHVGKTPDLTGVQLRRWHGWLGVIWRDQVFVWVTSCLLGVALPAVLSLEFLRGVNVEGHGAAALVAQSIAARHGQAFWYLTLLCGFLILAPGVIQTIDGVCRRWTDVAWSASERLRRRSPDRAYTVYYGIMGAYCVWGLLALGLTPNPLVLAILGSTLGNLGLAMSALHVIHVGRTLMPREARPGWFTNVGLALAAVFFAGISAIAFASQYAALRGR
ncbi:MAG: Nramp family divalent metal transporter [Bryobacteraceae bacterium]